MLNIVTYTDREPPANRYPPQTHYLAPEGGRPLLLRDGVARFASDGRAPGVPGPALSAVRLCRPGDPPRDPGHNPGERPA